jgi:hypothetical protein
MAILQADVTSNTVILKSAVQALSGEASFSLSNTSGRELSVTVQILADNPKAMAWVSFPQQDPANRQPLTRLDETFRIGETRQYSVKINVPTGTEPGSYSIRLRAAEESLPDENWVESPSVVFEVAQVAQPAKPAFPWWIIAVVLAVLLIVGGVIAFLLLRPKGDGDVTLTPAVTITPPSTEVPTNPADAFVGNWVNEDPATRSLTHAEIHVTGNTISVHLWGACSPSDCDWGEATTFVQDADDGVIEITWNQGFVLRHQKISILSDGRLEINTHSVYTDTRSPMDSVDRFVRN